MSALKATPGPWEVSAGGGFIESSGVVLDTIARLNVDLPGATAIANGHLIAAAPDLFEALKRVLVDACRCLGAGVTQPMPHSNIGSKPCTNPWCVQARAALAKARGES